MTGNDVVPDTAEQDRSAEHLPDDHPSTEYTFSNRAPQAPGQLAALQHYLDPVTTGVLGRTEVSTGARCLEIGAGGGSIAGWLADRVGPDGRVVAVDLDPSHLHPYPGVEVRQHDIRRGLPDGPFDLIHARLVLLHLPERRLVLRRLVDRLAPGGWLVLGEFSDHPLQVVSAADPADGELFRRVIDALSRVLTRHGADLTWAGRIHPAMREAGLEGVHTVEYAESWSGGSAGASLHHVNVLQKQDELLASGLTDAELHRFRQVVADPRFCARSWQFVCSRGQRPGS